MSVSLGRSSKGGGGGGGGGMKEPPLTTVHFEKDAQSPSYYAKAATQSHRYGLIRLIFKMPIEARGEEGCRSIASS